jgi:tetratricopeptide (TPR) repeat protein
LRIAANQAMAVDDLKAALDRVERGVRLGAQGDDLAELRAVEAEARYWKAEYVESERAAREARKSTEPNVALRATSTLIDALGFEAKYDEITRLTEELKGKPSRPDLLNPWLLCKVNSAAYLASAGQFAAREQVLELLAASREGLDPVLVGRAETFKAHVARSNGKPSEFVEGFQHAWELFERAGDKRTGTEALGNAASGLMEAGQLEAAEECIRQLWAIAERMGLSHLLSGTHYLLGNILAYRGCLDEARRFLQNALRLSAEANEQHFRRYALLYLSFTEYMAKDFVSAERYARQAVELLETIPSLHPFALALLARSLNGQGATKAAMELASEAYRQLEAHGQVQDGEAIIRLAFIECSKCSSHLEEARVASEKAIEDLREKAATIDNLQWQNTFINNIPEHRSIIELAREIGVVTTGELSEVTTSE